MSVTADTDALVATVRNGVNSLCRQIMDQQEMPDDSWIPVRNGVDAALDALAAELERVKAERDDTGRAAIREAKRCDDFRKRWEVREREWATEHDRAEQADARLDKALAALREIAEGRVSSVYGARLHAARARARVAIAEIEGAAPSFASPPQPDPRLKKEYRPT